MKKICSFGLTGSLILYAYRKMIKKKLSVFAVMLGEGQKVADMQL